MFRPKFGPKIRFSAKISRYSYDLSDIAYSDCFQWYLTTNGVFLDWAKNFGLKLGPFMHKLGPKSGFRLISDANWLWLTLTDSDWLWLTLTDSDWSLTDSDWLRLILTASDWLWLPWLTLADSWLILINSVGPVIVCLFCLKTGDIIWNISFDCPNQWVHYLLVLTIPGPISKSNQVDLLFIHLPSYTRFFL